MESEIFQFEERSNSQWIIVIRALYAKFELYGLEPQQNDKNKDQICSFLKIRLHSEIPSQIFGKSCISVFYPPFHSSTECVMKIQYIPSSSYFHQIKPNPHKNPKTNPSWTSRFHQTRNSTPFCSYRSNTYVGILSLWYVRNNVFFSSLISGSCFLDQQLLLRIYDMSTARRGFTIQKNFKETE